MRFIDRMWLQDSRLADRFVSEHNLTVIRREGGERLSQLESQ